MSRRYWLEKAAASRLARELEIVKRIAKSKYGNPDTVTYIARLGGREVGGLTQVDGRIMGRVQVEPRLQGVGIGRRLYAAAVRDSGEAGLASDGQVSDAAAGVWNRLKRSSGFDVQGPAGDRATFVSMVGPGWSNKRGGSVYRGVARAPARKSIPAEEWDVFAAARGES